MTSKTPSPLSFAEFERLLDVYGSDRTRWPLGRRAAAGGLLVSDVNARRLLAETVALDTVLARAQPLAETPAPGLADRIMAAVEAEKLPRARPSGVLLPVKVSLRRASSEVSTLRVGSTTFQGVALLAASLMIGVFVGQSAIGERAVPALTALAGISVTADQSGAIDLHTDAGDDD